MKELATDLTKDKTDPVGMTTLIYQEIAADYAATWFDDPVMEPMLESFLEHIETPGEVLDAGCGPGRDVLAMARRNVEAVGIDLCAAMLAEARTRVPGGMFRQMDLRSLKYPPETFAGVWSCSALTHLPTEDAARALREAARVLKPEGVLGVSVEDGAGDRYDHLGRYRNLYETSAFCRLVEEAGFRIRQLRHSYSSKETLGGARLKKWIQVLAVKVTPSLSTTTEEEYDCLLCSNSRFKFNREVGLPSSGSILWGDDDTYVIPDIAPLLEGHLLIATARHYICYGGVPSSFIPKLQRIKDYVRRLFRDAYQQETLFFEHGPARCKRAGACIEHAHLHCLPVSLPAMKAVEQYFGAGRAASIDTMRHLYRQGQSYLHVEEGDEGRVYPVDLLTSQFLRQVVSTLIGQENWRWQTSCKTPQTQNAYRRTLERLLPLVDSK